MLSLSPEASSGERNGSTSGAGFASAKSVATKGGVQVASDNASRPGVASLPGETPKEANDNHGGVLAPFILLVAASLDNTS